MSDKKITIDADNYNDTENLCRILSDYAAKGYIPENMTENSIELKKSASASLDFLFDRRKTCGDKYAEKTDKYIYPFADKGYAPMCRLGNLYLFAKKSERVTPKEAAEVLAGMLICGGAVMLLSIFGDSAVFTLLAAVFAAGFGYFAVKCAGLIKRNGITNKKSEKN